jgi:hypothetical protein
MLNILKGALLGLVDKLNVAADPFQEFTRSCREVDPATLSQRDRIAWKDIQDNWLFGPNREFYWSMKPNDMGDMAIWHGLYTATCALRKDLPALARAVDGMEKLQFLGGNSRLARGADSVSGPHNVDPSRKYYAEGDYVWTDNCSESTLLGHLFGLMLCIGTPEEARAGKMATELARQLVKDGYRMLNQDGTPAKFGDLRPSLTTAPIRLAALACTFLLASVFEPDEFRSEYDKLVKCHMHSLTHPETHVLFVHPWYQDLIAYLALTILFQCDGNADNRAKYGEALQSMWAKNRKEGNTFYAACVVWCNGRGAVKPKDRDSALFTLREFSVTVPSGLKKPGSVDLTASKDVAWFTWGFGSKKMTVSKQPVPVWMRPPQDVVWQRCPYGMKGDSHEEFNFMDFCLAYSLAERAGLI